MDTSYLIWLLRERKLDLLVRDDIPYIVDISLYEYLRGEFCLRRDAKRAKRYVEKIFNIMHLDNKIIVKASEIWSDLARRGELIPEPDIIMGSSFIIYGLPPLMLDKKILSD